MFRVSHNALNCWWRTFVVTASLSTLLFLPVFLEIHHSCRLQHVTPDDEYADLAGSVGFCESCVLMRTLLADEQGEVVWGVCTVMSIGGCVSAEEPIVGNRADGPPPPRGPPAGRQHLNA